MEPCDPPRAVDMGTWLRVMRRVKTPESSVQHIAFVMASYGNPDGSRVFPGVARLVRVTRYAKATVCRAVKWLRETGFILLVKRGNRHAGDSDEYRLSVPGNIVELLSAPGALTPDEELITV